MAASAFGKKSYEEESILYKIICLMRDGEGKVGEQKRVLINNKANHQMLMDEVRMTKSDEEPI
jgi:hypothetical protein